MSSLYTTRRGKKKRLSVKPDHFSLSHWPEFSYITVQSFEMLQDVFSSEVVYFCLLQSTATDFSETQILYPFIYLYPSVASAPCIQNHALLWSCLLFRLFCFYFHLAFCTQNILSLSYWITLWVLLPHNLCPCCSLCFWWSSLQLPPQTNPHLHFGSQLRVTFSESLHYPPRRDQISSVVWLHSTYIF